MSGGPEWFAARRRGYGTGLPITWQGWVLLLAFVSVVSVAAAFLAPRSQLAFFALVAPLTVAFVWVAKKTTRGGWRWRWGERD